MVIWSGIKYISEQCDPCNLRPGFRYGGYRKTGIPGFACFFLTTTFDFLNLRKVRCNHDNNTPGPIDGHMQDYFLCLWLF